MAQPTLKITSPEDGTVVYSGDSLLVTVEAAPANAFQVVTIIGSFFSMTWDRMLQRPPYRFSIKISPRVSPRRYSLTADGIIRPGEGASSDPVGVQVEHPGTPLSLTAEPRAIAFKVVGDEVPLGVIGRFADDERVFLEDSSFIKFASDNASVTTVDSDGHVKAVGPGSAKITIRYKEKSTVVPVTVRKPMAGHVASLTPCCAR